MTPKLCAVTNCPAFADGRRKTCGPHQHARTAKDLHIAKDSEGRNGKRCLGCRRTFSESDFVDERPVKRERVKKGQDAFGWKHIACEPPSPRPSKKTIKESDKPLLEAWTDDIEADRGAA